MSIALDPEREEAGAEEPAASDRAEREAEAVFEAEARAAAETPLRRAGATYRLQVHKAFTFEDVRRIVDYLHRLGITDCYLSPVLAARPGSTHGYDVFDHRRLNPEIGDEATHARLVETLRARDMGRILDIVPNHMGIGGSNEFWLDVLETGPQAQSARFFDIDWDPVRGDLEDRVLIPMLEDLYGKVLEAGLIDLERDGGTFWVRYHDHRLPLNPRSYARVLDRLSGEFRAPVRSRRRGRRGVPEHPRRAREPPAPPCDGQARRRPRPPREGDHQAAHPPALRGEPEAPRIHRRRRRLVPRDPRRAVELRRPARIARGAGLSARLLAGGLRGDQLPAASSTSTSWPACGPRTRRSST